MAEKLYIGVSIFGVLFFLVAEWKTTKHFDLTLNPTGQQFL
jgi:hypothetical protein